MVSAFFVSYSLFCKTMKKFFLFLYGLLLGCAVLWAQSSAVVMELTDVFGDKHQVEMKPGSTIYLSQMYWGNSWKYVNEPLGSLVVCDMQGVPYFLMPMESLSSITYTGATGQTSYSLPNYVEQERDFEQNLLRWRIGGREYDILMPGEWKLSQDLKTLTLITALGQQYQMPLASVEKIWRCEPEAPTTYGLYDKLDDAQIYSWAFYNGQTGGSDFMGLNLYASLLPVNDGGMKNVTLLVPTDEALTHYTDVVTFKSKVPRVLRFYSQNGNFPVATEAYQYNQETYEVGGKYNAATANQTEIVNRLGIILRSHAIYHNRPEDGGLGIRSGNEYFVAEDGSIIRVVKDAQGEPIAVQGSYQIENEQKGLTDVTITEANKDVYSTPWSLTRANITERIEKGNAWVYKLDNAMIPTPRSAYSVLTSDGTFPEENPYKRFIELCTGIDSEIIKDCGLISRILPASQQKSELKKYNMFFDNNAPDYNLQWVGNCPFTLYVPTNEAIQRELSSGRLSSWEQIKTQFNALPKDEDGNTILSTADSLSLQKKILTLTNFIRAHIQFGVEIADQLPFERKHNTAVVKTTTLVTPQLTVRGLGKGKMTVTDETGNTYNILDARKNIFVREVSCSKTIKNVSDLRSVTINAYAPGVIHQIDGVLKYRE